jgi:hypothetical protein
MSTAFFDATAITITTGFLFPTLLSNKSSGDPSVSAKIGIGVAVPIAVVAILMAAFITW